MADSLKNDNLRKDIKKILEYNPLTRGDDMKLYIVYAYEKIAGLNVGAGWLTHVFDEKGFREKHNISNYDSVSRTRRYIQRIYPHLRADEKIQEGRAEKEREYYEFYREHRG